MIDGGRTGEILCLGVIKNSSGFTKQVSLSFEFYCNTGLFQRNVHLSPVDYLNQLRIHMSLSEIIKHEKKITDIAKMYGFSGSSYFSEMFKKTLGITPRAFYKSVLQQQTLSSNADPIHGRR